MALSKGVCMHIFTQSIHFRRRMTREYSELVTRGVIASHSCTSEQRILTIDQLNVINISVRVKCEPILFHTLPESYGFVEIREMCASEEVDLIKLRKSPANPGKLSLRSHA